MLGLLLNPLRTDSAPWKPGEGHLGPCEYPWTARDYLCHMRFSSRVDISGPNPISSVEAAARTTGRPLVALSDSNPTRHGLAPHILPSLYTPDPRGEVGARARLADFLSTTQHRVVDPDDLYLLSSTSQAYSWLIKLLCDPGDAVLSPAPGYPLVDSIARLEGVGALSFPLHRYGRWEIDTAAVEELVNSPAGRSVRAIIAINPNNPTGSYVTADECARLVDICRRHELPLIADEVFFDYHLAEGRERSRIAGRDEVLTFALDGLSKRLAAPHAKLAWIEVSGPDDQVAEAKRRLDAIADDFLPLGALITERMPEFCEQMPGQTESVRTRCLTNLAALRELVDSEPSGALGLLEPEGGWNALVRFPSTIDEDEFVTRLITDDALTVQPGYFFDMPQPGYVSVSLLLEPGVFREAASILIGRLGRAASGLS